MRENRCVVTGIAIVVALAPVLGTVGMQASAGSPGPSPADPSMPHALVGEIDEPAIERGDRYGAAVDVDAAGDTAVVGAYRTEGTGAAYVYERAPTGGWDRVAVLISHDRARGDDVGKAVAISDDGSTILLGTPGDDKKNDAREGAVYVFEEDDGEWRQTAKLSPGWVTFQRRFGRTVDLDADGSTALVTARSRPNAWAGPNGDAFVYTESEDGWTLEATLDSEQGNDERLAWWSAALSRDGDRVITAAPTTPDGGGAPGAAVVFERDSDGAWTETAWLEAPDGAPSFGASVDLDAGIALVGAPHADQTGLAYAFFRLPDGSWSDAARIEDPIRQPGDGFGETVDLLGGLAVIGTPDASNASIVPVTPAGGTPVAWIGSPGSTGDGFGSAVALAPTGILVGAPVDGGGHAYTVPTSATGLLGG